jgi:putative nucleotidyltransferase with HDIG domain
MDRVSRALTLMRAFVLLSAVLLGIAGVVLGSVLTRALREQALADSKVSLTEYTGGVLTRDLVRGRKLVVGQNVRNELRRDIEARPDVLSVKVWRPDGVLAWTSLDPKRIGHRFPLGHDLEEVLETGEAEAGLEDLGDAEDSVEARLGFAHVLEVYAPVFGPNRKVIGAFEIYADSSRLEVSIAKRKRTIWFAVGLVFLVLFAALAVLVRGASSMLRGQREKLRDRSRALLESYRRLEESSLEAIESLNATVEAKDPYTAGHSVRVQQIALAVGEELGLPEARLDALRFGGLFHDIGKLAVPDAVLTKPARLTDEEFEVIKRHSADGARIVEKFSRLREAVPIIRHHHERWVGGGYPDGLAGEQIPVEAAIVGLADAWDAMTTVRPYQRALTVEEASRELRDGRGTQFSPTVVDAFFAAARRQPALLFALAREPQPDLTAVAG